MTSTSGRRNQWQRWLFAGLVAAFLWMLARRFAEIQELVGALAQGRWPWIVAAVILELAYHVGFAALFQSAFRLIGVPSRLKDLIPIAFAFLFVNTTTASGGTTGLALFVEDVRRRGGSAAQATAATLLAHTANYGMFAFLLTFGLLYLFIKHNLTGLEIISALIMFLIVGGLGSTLVLAWRWPDTLRRLFGRMQRMINWVGGWVKRPSLLPDAWAEQTSLDFIAAAEAITQNPWRLGNVLLAALLVHAIQTGVLFAIFEAFSQPVTPGILLAGYSVSVLFMIVSPTPNGIGVVEAIVPIMYNSLGISTHMGVTVTFAFRGITFWIPMLIGFVLLRQLAMFRGPGRTLAESGQVRLLAVLTGLMGALNIISAIRPDLLAPFSGLTQYSPVAVREGGRIAAIVTGFFLLVLATGLWRQKRAAWWMTLIVLATAVAGHLLQLDYAAAVLGVLLAALLVVQRNHFWALSDPPSVWQGVKVLAASLVFILAYGLIGFYLLARHSGQSFDLGTAGWRTLLLFSTLLEPSLRPQSEWNIFANSIYLVGAVTLTYALFMLLRPVVMTPAATIISRRRAQRIVVQHGRSALAEMALLSDKSYYFTLEGSVVAYMRHRRAAIALGDPVGPPEDLTSAVTGFRDECRHHDWQAAFYNVPETTLPIYEAAGFQALCIGHDNFVDLANVPEPDGPVHFQTTIYRLPVSSDLIAQLRLVSDEWLTMTGQRERPFTGDWFSRETLHQGVLAVVTAPSGDLLAFATAARSMVAQEMSIGMLRYRQAATREELLALHLSLARWGASQGLLRLNLGLSRLEVKGRKKRRPLFQRILENLHLRVTAVSNQDILHQIQAQLAAWQEDRYLVYATPASLPAVWAALIGKE